MKRALQLIVLGLFSTFYLPNQLSAQITLTVKDYPLKVGSDSLSFNENGSAIAVPQGGADMKWDYSNLSPTFTRVDQVLDGTGQAAFDEATHKHREVFSVQSFRFRAMDYEKLDANSFTTVGRIQFDTTHSLLTVTGNAADEMHFPYYEQKFTHPRNKIKFPYTYQDKWEEMDIQLTKFDLTVAAFGLNKTPGEIVRRRFQKREVIGYGELTLPDGSGGKSQPIHVLLVNIKDSIVDSVFLAGSPAPPSLLAAFNFTQGHTWHYEAYAFEMRGLGRQPLGFIMDEDGKVDYAYYRPRATRLVVGVNESIVNRSTSVYPSQIRAGESIHLQGFPEQPGRVRLLAMDGRTYNLRSTSSYSYQVPNIVQGMYLIHITDADGRTQVAERISIVK